MGITRTHTTKTQTPRRRQRSTTAIESGNPQRHSLDLAIRCQMERPPRKISTISNLSSALSILGAHGNTTHHFRNDRQRLARTWQVRLDRMLYRRDLYGGEKRGFGLGKTKRGKGTKLMAVADGTGLPLAVHATSASPHEITLVLDTLKERFLRQPPVRLIGDRAYDSDPLDETLAQQHIELIAPHKFNRVKPITQKMVVSYDDMFGDGRSNGSLLGSKIIAECLSATIIILTIFLALFTSLVFSFLCGDVFETASNDTSCAL